jgi:hypothetical protein
MRRLKREPRLSAKTKPELAWCWTPLWRWFRSIEVDLITRLERAQLNREECCIIRWSGAEHHLFRKTEREKVKRCP